jgi:bis(5'-nucleosyl)-tetraphosphatase (symmetrical)
MSIYAIGDLQGCYDELQMLLEKIQFDPTYDTLWFTGDLVNRGPKSLDCLRFVKNLGDKAVTILGNHDLHLLAVAAEVCQQADGDTLDDILKAHDRDELLGWLRQQPLLHYDSHLNYVLVHAGIAPAWNLVTAQRLAREVEVQLRTSDSELLAQLYGDQPACWEESLTGVARWRCIINYFTRMRFCTAGGCLDLKFKGEIDDAAADLLPWFKMPNRQTEQQRIIFGHWAALQGNANTENVFALDTGCVWGQSLTAMRLEDQAKISLPAHVQFSS